MRRPAQQQVTKWFGMAAMALSVAAAWQLWLSGQQPPGAASKSGATNRLEFEVVQSFDAKYLGDTPGHMGRAGGLENRRPRIALGDPIFSGEERVGIVTGLQWNRTNTSLDIEFDPVDHARICVGDQVWMAFDDRAPARGAADRQTK